MKRLLHATLVALLPALALATPVTAPPAHAQGRVEVANDRGGAEADLRYRTSLTVRGAGFQAVPGGFGGVYVMFGWVRDPGGGAWRPTRGGLTGQDYRYVPDAEDAADSQGYLRFVAFPGSSTAGEATAVLGRDGSFEVDLTVPGPVFQSVDRSGEVVEVDCREVTCGVITLGAHGVKNGRNETFTPVRFARVYDAEPAAPAEAEPDPSPAAGGAGPAAGATPPRAPAAAGPTGAAGAARPGRTARAAGPAALTVDRATAVAGHTLVFSARGFTPGEQVVAVLGDGEAALGPVVAGTAGEVAGALSLPLDLPVGTHELRLVGAASGTTVTERFPVAAGDAAPTDAPTDAAAAPADGGPGLGLTPGTVFLVVALAAFLLALGGLVRSLLARGRRRRPATETVAGAVA